MPERIPDPLRSESDERLAEAILYVSRRLAANGDRFRGAVKLNKVLWRADFEHFRRYGQALTGAPYQRLSEGPAPVRLLPVRDELIRRGDAQLERSDVGASRPEEILHANREADRTVLGETERKSLDEAIAYFHGRSGSEVSELSHRESVGWKSVRNGEVIPYETAVVRPGLVDFPRDTNERVAALVSRHQQLTTSPE